jgi:Uma2 family endonuclease
MAETDIHRQGMTDLIETLQAHFEADPMVYVSGNLLLFYEEGNRRKHVSPDVLVVRGVPKRPPRLHYLTWREGKGPDLVIELTSKTTRAEDQRKKLGLYRDVLRVPEYFLFDPFEDWLKPSMQGYRLVEAGYDPIEPIEGRLPSEVLGLHLGRGGIELRLYDPETGRMLPTSCERVAGSEAELRITGARLREVEARLAQTDAERRLAETKVQLLEERLARSEAERRLAELEADRLRRELESRGGRPPGEP